MNRNTICATVLILLASVLIICNSAAKDKIHEYEDPVIDGLLNGESFENDQEEILGKLPIFKEGMWKCGDCDVLDERKLINRDFYSVDKNVDDELFQVQVGLALENTKCVTIISESDIELHLVSGSCDGAHVTFNILHATNFTVNVYSL